MHSLAGLYVASLTHSCNYGVALLSTIFLRLGMDHLNWVKLLACVSMLLTVNGNGVPIAIVENDVVAKGGGVCLDGSPPAYHFDKGFGAGVKNWLITVEGGGFCNTISDCHNRSRDQLGSSKYMKKYIDFEGMLSNNSKFNPDFYNWNRVFVRYCDGSGFIGDVEAVDPKTGLHFRGARVWRAIMDDLLPKGLKNAQNAILSGRSSGGHSAMLHCDDFRYELPHGAKVKCLSDAGFMINITDISGEPRIQKFFAQVVDTHGSAKNLPQSCTSKFDTHLCMFPQLLAKEVQTPLFILNSAYDRVQIDLFLAPDDLDHCGQWKHCKADLAKCTKKQLRKLQELRKKLLAALLSLGKSSSRGLFINSCYTHTQSDSQATWLSDSSPMLDDTTISKAVGDWFHDKKPFQRIDCPYPCDKTCPHSAKNSIY